MSFYSKDVISTSYLCAEVDALALGFQCVGLDERAPRGIPRPRRPEVLVPPHAMPHLDACSDIRELLQRKIGL